MAGPLHRAHIGPGASIWSSERGRSTNGNRNLDRKRLTTMRITKAPKPYRPRGFDPDDPAVVAAIDMVRWELSLLLGFQRSRKSQSPSRCADASAADASYGN